MDAIFQPLMPAITDLGDSAVLSGVVFITSLYLWASGCRRTVLILLVVFFTTAAGIGLLKITFFSCRARLNLPFDIHSPSGHAALTTAVWGTIALILRLQYAGWKRHLTLIFITGLVIAIAATRLALHYHTLDEILAGLGVGGLGLLLAWSMLRRFPVQKFHPLGLVIAATLAAVALHGLRLPAEEFMKLLAHKIQDYWPFCGQKSASE